MIPLISPDLGPKEAEYLQKSLASGWIGGKGEYIDKFEAKFAKFIGVHHAITTSSGTSALFLAYLACGMKPESRVVAPYQTFAATYNMAKALSQKVMLIKGDVSTWNLNVSDVDTDFFVGVHLYGNPVDMGNLYKGKFTFIEDCAQSLGSEFKGKKTGSFGLVSCFSFHSAKTITTGEGGMVCTNDKEVADKVRHLKNHCMIEPYIHDNLGWNFRMTNLQAAVGLAQLERVEEILDKKRAITKHYEEGLSGSFVRQEETRKSKVVKWMNAYSLLTNSSGLRNKLKEKGIETRPGFNRDDIICLPSGSTLSKEDQDYVIKEANEATA